jgi:U32 family peptidase
MSAGFKIVAPVCSAYDAEKLISSGADELYCGAMFDDWVGMFGDADLISRRQGRFAHVRRQDELTEIIQVAADAGVPTALALNARYTRPQEPAVQKLAAMWEDIGGNAVIVSDIGMLLFLMNRRTSLKRHLSLLTGTFNSLSISFFADFGISRVVLPRDLRMEEIGAIVESYPKMEYEALAINQKCQFIDGMCGFYHGVTLPSGVPAAFDFYDSPGRVAPFTLSHDPEYEGHGCQLPWQSDQGPVRHLYRDDFYAPHCAACLLMKLSRIGIQCLKIAGRGYPVDRLADSVRFLRESINIQQAYGEADRGRQEIQELYARTFGNPCGRTRCYYILGNHRQSME